ncbi:MAG: PKD domain-containing protein [Bacteroidia bacterium]
MKKIYVCTSILLAVLTRGDPVYSQICDAITPVFTVNLTGQPNGTWISPSISRNGYCCGVSGSDQCVEFIITLDSSANGINFSIASGAVSGGSMFYQVDCGPPVSVGAPVCLNGPGPHLLTFCKPGNNTNTYQITSIPQPALNGTQWVSQACTGNMNVSGLEDTSITWTSVPYNSAYNSFLSCTNGCTAVIVTPSGTTLPSFVDYQVCGYVTASCASVYFCDTIRINFVNNLAVAIAPLNPVICFGGSNSTVIANALGGLAPYNYLWSNGATTQSITTSAGTYTVQLQDSMSCSIITDTVIITALASPIFANAGTDQLLCTNQGSVILNGSVSAATGGVWIGGSGIFSPNNTTLNVNYTPSATEIASGNAQLLLVTTGNYSCPADTDIIAITISQNPVPSIIGNSNLCENSTQVYTALLVSDINYQWTATGGNIISANTNSVTVQWDSAGNYTITLTETNVAGCDSSITVSVTINPDPVPVINGPSSVCTTTITQYTVANPVAGNSYNWSVTGGSISGDSNSSSVIIQWTTAGNATITVTESNSFGCDSTVMIPINILAMPTPAISGPATVCEFQTLTYSTPYVSGNTYTWNVTGGTIVANNNNSLTVNWPAAGIGTVTLEEANTLVCDSTVALNVMIGAQPVPVINGTSSVCTSTISQYTVANFVAGNSYNWTVTGGSISGSSNTSSVNIQWTNAGNATITVTESNSFGCDSTVMIPVNILAMPTPAISGPANACEFQTITYSTPYVSGNTYTWNVTGGTIVANSNNSITVNWPVAGNGTVTLAEANSLVCDSTISVNIFIGPQPVPVINGPSSICTATYAQYSVSAVTGDSYSWTITGGTIIGSFLADHITVLWSSTGAGLVSVIESNVLGCDSSVSFPVDVRLKPAPSLSGPPANCEMDTTTYSVQNVIGDTYIWNVNGGSIVGFAVGSSIEVLWTSPGNGEVVLRQVSPDGCDSVVSKAVFINPLPQPVISGPVIVCEDEPVAYNVTFVSSDFYNWTASPGNINGSHATNTVSIMWPNNGIGVVTLVQTTPQGCSAKAEFLTVINEKPHPSIVGNNLGCISNAQNNYSSVYEPGINYTWNVSGGNVTNGNGSSAVTIEWSTPGINTISLSAVNPATGCVSTVAIFVHVDSLAYPVIQAAGQTGCIPVNLDFNGNIINPNYYYSWNFGDGTSIHTANPYHIYSVAGTYTVQLIAINNTGCADTVYTEVRAYPIPTADFSLWYGSQPYYAGLSTLAIENYSGGASQYAWNFGDGSGSLLFEPQHDYTLPGIYSITLVASNQWGCSNSTAREIIVKVPEEIFIPNAFSPNNDHVNDYFSVEHNNITQLSVSIYNRWGERLYASQDISFKWDGTFQNKPIQEGVYVYAIQAKGYHGRKFNLYGNLTLIR